MLECRIALRLPLSVQRISPASAVVAMLLRIVAGEKTVGEAVAVADDPGGVGVLTHVLFLNPIMLDGIVDHTADEGDVGTRAQFGEHVRDRAGAIEMRVHVQDIGAALLGARQPIHRDGMIFRRVPAHDQDDIGVQHVDPMVGHRPSTERGRQTDDRGAVSEPGLVFDIHQAEGPHQFHEEISLLIVQRRAAETGDCLGAVYHPPVYRRLESFIASFFDSRSDPLERPIPSLLLPRHAVRFAVEYFLQAPRVVHYLNPRRALAAQGAFANGMGRVALDVDHLAAARGDYLAAADAAEGTDRCRSGCTAGFERWNRRSAAGLSQSPDRYCARCEPLEELATRRPRRL